MRCDSSAKLTPPIAATSLMSLSARPARDEPNVKAFFSFEASLAPVGTGRGPLIPPGPTETVAAEVVGFVAVLDVGTEDVDATVTKGVGPGVMAVGADVTPPTCGRWMVKAIGAGDSEVMEGSVLIVETAVIVVEAAAAVVVAVTLGACWAALAFGVALLAAGLGGRGAGRVPAEAPTIVGVWSRTCPPIGRTVCICVGPAFTRLTTLCC
jgi:hypothetical protein